ncbi:hypothetical protein B0I71DRAFT_168036 [Yarrowia lipolytica]|uniref:Peptidase S54 rhomboid domain-containing protein n=1 Tax=Yarrowia lipolytica TaxID=4952 RepID=A0A371C2D2_YARLL|nr:hypothetical protein B0I71DRAFT_168036 [Yarrowia lipolytica]
MNIFRGNIVLGRLTPGFWKSTQTLGPTSNHIVKNVVGPTPGQINTMFRQKQRLGKRSGIADRLNETSGKLIRSITIQRRVHTTQRASSLLDLSPTLLTAMVSEGFTQEVIPPSTFLAKALAISINTFVVFHFAFPLLFEYTPIRRLAQRPDWVISAIIGPSNPWIIRLMFENMLLKTGPGFRPAQLIGPVFSPQEFGCFFVNMLVLYQFGVPVIMTMESFWFCQMYMISVVSSCTTCSCSPFLGRATMSLGASGAIFSVVGVFCSVFPNDLFNFFSISPSIDAWWLLLVPWPVNQIRS